MLRTIVPGSQAEVCNLSQLFKLPLNIKIVEICYAKLIQVGLHPCFPSKRALKYVCFFHFAVKEAAGAFHKIQETIVLFIYIIKAFSSSTLGGQLQRL